MCDSTQLRTLAAKALQNTTASEQTRSSVGTSDVTSILIAEADGFRHRTYSEGDLEAGSCTRLSRAATAINAAPSAAAARVASSKLDALQAAATAD